MSYNMGGGGWHRTATVNSIHKVSQVHIPLFFGGVGGVGVEVNDCMSISYSGRPPFAALTENKSHHGVCISSIGHFIMIPVAPIATQSQLLGFIFINQLYH